MPNILEIKHGNAVPVDGDLEPYELGYCDSNGFLYIGKQSEEGEKKTEEIKLPTNYYTILYGSDNYLNNSLTMHYINLNDPANRDGVITTTNASTIASLPPTLTGPFCAYKKTFLQKRKDEQGYYNMFQILFEMYPVRGRIWTNAFSFEDNEQGQWGAWKASSFLNYDSFDNYNLSLGYTETANKESGISIYRKDANGILKLSRFYMEDYPDTSSLSLVQTSALNGIKKSAMTLRMNWNGEDFRLYSRTVITGNSYLGQSADPWTGVYALSYNSGSWNGNTIPIARGGTGATSASTALSNLGGLSKFNARLVDLWNGSAGNGTSITIPNGRLYSLLLFVGSPGSGEDLTSLALGGSFTGSYQIVSNSAFFIVKLSASGNNVVVRVEASEYKGVLKYVFGIIYRN